MSIEIMYISIITGIRSSCTNMRICIHQRGHKKNISSFTNISCLHFLYVVNYKKRGDAFYSLFYSVCLGLESGTGNWTWVY